jgi:hypothetical protein
MSRWHWAALGLAALASLLAVLALFVDLPGAGSPAAGRPASAAIAAQLAALGDENTSFSVQNTGIDPARFVVDYYDADGTRVTQDTIPDVPAGASMAFHQDSQEGLPQGFSGSAVVTSDQSVRTVILKQVDKGNGVLSAGGDDGVTRGFSRVYLPLVYSRYGPDEGWNTRLILQNVSSGTIACVRMTYRDEAGQVALVEPGAGGQLQPQCPQGGLLVAPGSVLERDHAEMAGSLPANFQGSLVVELVTNDEEPAVDTQVLAATVDVYHSQRASFATYRGLGWSPAEGSGDLSTGVYLPLVHKNAGGGGGWNTRFFVSPVDPAQPAALTLFYCCDSRLAGAGGSLERKTTVTAWGIVDPAQDAGLPDGFEGSLRIASDEAVGVVATWSWVLGGVDTFAAYSGVPQSEASTAVWVPLLYRDFGYKGPTGEARGWNSWLRVQVTDGGTANVRITYHGANLPGGSASFSEDVTGARFFIQTEDPLLPVGFEGAAVVVSDRPVAVLAGVSSDAYQGDADAMFTAFGPDVLASPPGSLLTMSLAQGWTHTCYVGIEQPVDVALADVLGDILAVYRLRADQGYDRWFAGRPELSTLTSLSPNDALLVLTSASATWVQELPGTPPTFVTLTQGWNSTCYAGQTKAVELATADIDGQFSVLYSLGANQSWRRYVPGRPDVSTIMVIDQNNALLILKNTPGNVAWTFQP